MSKVGLLKWEVPEGEVAPWWLGLSYHRYDARVSICHPVPFNWLCRWVRAAWGRLRLAAGPKTVSEVKASAWNDGYGDGYKNGFADGTKHGRRTEVEELLAELSSE